MQNIFGPDRRSIRIQGYDYTSEGMYYVTVCTKDRRQILGEVKQGEMCPLPLGEMVKKVWSELSRYDPRVSLDQYEVMPDHFHGILMIGSSRDVMNVGERDLGQARGPAPTLALPDLMQRFKSWTTRRSWKIDPSLRGPLWQRSYYEHIVRSEADLNRIREYIKDNPKNWNP
jgi:putative transposase